MSVASWKRSLSNIEYLHKTFELEKRIIQITYNVPTKYRKSFGDVTIHLCSDALYHGTTANNIRIIDNNTYDARVIELNTMKAAIEELARQIFLWLEAVREHDGINKKLDDKFYKYENEIGDTCDTITRLIDGVLRSDRIKYNKILEGGNGD